MAWYYLAIDFCYSEILTSFECLQIEDVDIHAPIAQLDRVPGFEPGG